MSRLRLTLVAAIAVLALAAPVAAMSPAKLTGTVGPGFTITLTQGGKRVTKLHPGKYTITVNDKSAIHSFHLSGPGVNKAITSVPFVGKKTVTVTLKKGKYTYRCDAHPTTMIGSFTVA